MAKFLEGLLIVRAVVWIAAEKFGSDTGAIEKVELFPDVR
jgi:hypothetical protein